MNALPPNAPDRITMKGIFAILLEQFHLERGIGYTIKRLLTRPRAAIEEYLYEDRKRMIQPFRFVLLTAAIATFISYYFLPLGDELLKELQQDPEWERIPAFLKPTIEYTAIITNKYFNLLFMSSIPFVSLASYWVFNKANFNFAEHLVLNCYLFCIQTIFYIFTIPFMQGHAWVAYLQAILVAGYTLFAYLLIFRQKFWMGLWKVLLVWLIAQALTLAFGVLVFGISLLF